MTAAIQQLQPWFDAWIPPFLLGGLKHWGAREAHEVIHHDIFQAMQTDKWIAEPRSTSKSALISVSPEQAILGAPREILGILEFFYQTSARRFESRGAVAQHAITCSRSILQGCPALSRPCWLA